MGGGTVSADVKKGLILVCAALVMLVTAAVELPAGFREAGTVVLSRAGQRSLAVLLFTLILWLTEAVPFHVTGLLGVFFLAVLKVGSFSEIVAAGFGNDIVVFFIGVLTLSTFITKAGLGNRISVFLLSKTGNRTSTILLGFLVVGALLSMWITNTAVAAMLMPLAVAVLREEGLKPLESRFGKALMISTAWGPIIGGIMAPSGAGPNPLAIGFLKEMAGIEVSFIEWMSYGVPAGLMLLFPTWLVLLLFFRPEITHLKKSREELKAEYRELAKMDREEKVTTVLFVLTVLLWLVTPLLERMLGIGIPISMPVLLSSSLFFFPKGSRISWREVEREIPWSSILLIVSGISIGMFLFRSGAAEWLAVSVLGGIGSAGPFVRVFLVVLVISFLKIIFSSNTVTATIISPLMITLAMNLGIEPLSIAMPAALTTSMAFILVTSSPTNVIPYSTGYFTIKDMALSGVVITVIGSFLVSIVIFLVGSVKGIF